MLAIGIDPGISGGIASIRGRAQGPVCAAEAMPATTADIVYSLECLRGFSSDLVEPIRVVIEKVGPMPKQGISSTWKFAENYGILLGVLAAFKMPYYIVAPSKWQAYFGLTRLGRDKTAKKNKHKGLAQQLFPELKVTHKTADALLLAHYARYLYCTSEGEGSKECYTGTKSRGLSQTAGI